MADDRQRKMVETWAGILRTGEMANFIHPGRLQGVAGKIRRVEVDWPRLGKILHPEDKAG